jgi:hypothetical protein
MKEMNASWNMEKVQQVLDRVQTNWDTLAKEWCTCSQDGEGLWNGASEGYTFHCPPNLKCPLCKVSIDNDHYHCGVCSKISQVG